MNPSVFSIVETAILVLILSAGFAAQPASAVPLGSVLDEVCADADIRLQRDQVTYKAMQSARGVDVSLPDGTSPIILSTSDGAMYTYLDKLQIPPLKLYADKGMLEAFVNNWFAYTDNKATATATTAKGNTLEFEADGKPTSLSDFVVAYDQTKTVKLGEQTVGVDEVMTCPNGLVTVFVNKMIQPDGTSAPGTPALSTNVPNAPVAPAPAVAGTPVTVFAPPTSPRLPPSPLISPTAVIPPAPAPIASTVDGIPPALAPVSGGQPPESSSNAGLIAGVAVGSIFAVAVIAGAFFVVRKRRQNRDTGLKTPLDTKLEEGSPDNPSKSFTAEQPMAISQIAAEIPPTRPDQPSILTKSAWMQRDDLSTVDPLMAYISSNLASKPRLSSRSSTGGGITEPASSWHIDFSTLAVEHPIGEGSWGRVYKATWHRTDVAVKVLIDEVPNKALSSALVQPSNEVKARLEQESDLMSNLRHPNVVQFLGICSYPAAIVVEYCPLGSLDTVLKAANADPAVAAEVCKRRVQIAAEAARGIIYLHSRSPPVIHRDLKSANILLSASWSAKISDFNLSKILEETSRSSSLQATNPRQVLWLAPEVLLGHGASPSSDVFSFGVVLWELLTWQLPWGSSNPWGIVANIQSGKRLPIPPASDLPGAGTSTWQGLNDYVVLLQRCWDQNAAKRPNFEQIATELDRIQCKN